MGDQTPGLSHSIHTDTDVAMEMGGSGMSFSQSDACRTKHRAEVPPEQTRMMLAPELVSSLTKGMTAATTEVLEKFICPPPVDDAADVTIQECFLQRRARASQPAPTQTSGRTSAFNRWRTNGSLDPK